MKTLAKQITHIGRVRQNDLTTSEKVSQLLGWSHDQYCNHQYEEYEAFLARENAAYPEIREELRYSATFRGFWNNEWTLRNQQEFLPFATECEMGEAYMTDEYLFINNHMRLINDLFFMNKYEYILNMIIKQ